ncbi:transposase [Nonomuraea fuscirosea]
MRGWRRRPGRWSPEQACRESAGSAARQHWDAIAKALKPVYAASTEAAALERFLESAELWGGKYPAIVKSWKDAQVL